MSRWQITDATREDAGPLARILGDWVRETGWMPVLHSRDEDAGFVESLLDTHRVRVVRDEAGPQGFLARQGGYIAALHLAGPVRGKGIGTALLDEVKADEAEVWLWTFQANTRAIAFYLGAGFAEAERTAGGDNEERLPDLRLIWRRTP